jgi:hypothetical protein
MAEFLRKKFAPIPGTAVDLLVGENVVREKVTPLSAARNLMIPISMREVIGTMQSRGVPDGTIVSMLSLLGAGGGTYGPRTKYANATPTEREEILKKDLKSIEWNSSDPAYKEFLTTEQIDKFNKQREARKQSLVYEAAESPDRKKHKSDETYERSVASQKKAMEELAKSGLSYEECRQLLIDYYKRNYGSAYQMKGGTYRMKESLVERIREIRKKLNAK